MRFCLWKEMGGGRFLRKLGHPVPDILLLQPLLSSFLDNVVHKHTIWQLFGVTSWGGIPLGFAGVFTSVISIARDILLAIPLDTIKGAFEAGITRTPTYIIVLLAIESPPGDDRPKIIAAAALP